jgi:hypothetical protein
MAGTEVNLRGDLEGVVVELGTGRQITRVTKNGKILECEKTALGTFCKVVGDAVPGPGDGPVLQFRVSKTKKSLFARAMPESAGGLETAGKAGFQRHAL